jgi:hypothetical protein
MRVSALSLGIGFATGALAVPAAAWGPSVHQAVVARAIDTLPSGLKPFYKNHRLEIPTLSPDEAVPEEGRERRFAVDRFLPFPFLDLPRTQGALAGRFGPEAVEAGKLPWLILDSYRLLVAAMKAGDKARILAESDTLAGLVADLHNPLALTDNWDGQKTAQHGLWTRVSVKLPEAMGGGLKLSPDSAHLLDDPEGYVFSMLNACYVWVDNILYAEDLARRSAPGYTAIYYDALKLRIGDLLKQRLSQATGDVGSFWYTAWTAAGRPELK